MEIEVTVNGDRQRVEAHPMARLLDVLREQLELTGTKEGCGEGECGACTVLLDGRPVLSCLVPLVQCTEREIETVERAWPPGAAASFLEQFVATGGVSVWCLHPGNRGDRPRRCWPRALHLHVTRCSRLWRGISAVVTGYEGIFRALIEEPET